MFQGGGSLGAFAAGAWQAVSRSWARDDTLIAVAGSSIGAVTAATIAHSHDAADRGAGALTAPEDGVSGQFDYSPDRIERLLDQGRRAASRALAA